MQAQASRRDGFTIVELLVVIVVIGVLAAITIVSYSGIAKQATVASLKSDLSNAARQLKVFQVDNGYYPTSVNTCPATADTMCLKPSKNNIFDDYNRGSTGQTFALRAKNGRNVFIITDNSAPSEVAPLTAIAAVTGTVQVGTALTAGALTPSGATATYQWQRADTSGGTYTSISGATNSTYTPVSGDVNKHLRVVAIGTGTYWDTVISAAVGPVVTPPVIFATGGDIATSGGYRTHTFTSGTYNLTASYAGSFEVVIKGAGGGGGEQLEWYGGNGGDSSIKIGAGSPYVAYGGRGGVPDEYGGANGADGSTSHGSISGVIGGADNGGDSGGGGNGGNGGLVTGLLSVSSGQTLQVIVGSGGAGCGGTCGSWTNGGDGLVTIRYPG